MCLWCFYRLNFLRFFLRPTLTISLFTSGSGFIDECTNSIGHTEFGSGCEDGSCFTTGAGFIFKTSSCSCFLKYINTNIRNETTWAYNSSHKSLLSCLNSTWSSCLYNIDKTSPKEVVIGWYIKWVGWPLHTFISIYFITVLWQRIELDQHHFLGQLKGLNSPLLKINQVCN